MITGSLNCNTRRILTLHFRKSNTFTPTHGHSPTQSHFGILPQDSSMDTVAPAPTMRPSTKQDLTVAQQRPVFLQDAGMQMTYDLGGSVATDHDGHVFRATDEQITQALIKAARFGVISYTSVEDWLHTHVGQAAVIQTVAQKLIDMERLSGKSLEAWSDKKENISPNLPIGDAETACDMLANLLVEHDEYEKVREENLIFRKYRKVQSDWRQFRIRSVQLETKKQQLLLEHAREDMCQKQESHLIQLQLIHQEKARQERLDQEKHARRAVQLEAIEREHEEQEEEGRAIKQRGQIIHSDLSRLPEREETRPLQQNKAFLQAFLQSLRQTSRQQKNQVAGIGADNGNSMEDNAGSTTNGPLPSGSVSPMSQGHFFRSDSDVDDDIMAGKGEGGLVELNPLDLWT